MESALPAAGFLYWVGAGTVAYVALRISYSLFTALRVWGLSHEAGVGPRLGEWAGECSPAPPVSSLLRRLGRLPAGVWPVLPKSGPSAWPSALQVPSPSYGSCVPCTRLAPSLGAPSPGLPGLASF